jgi:hypothetical protein
MTTRQMHRICSLTVQCLSLDHPRLAFSLSEIWNSTEIQMFLSLNSGALSPAIRAIGSTLKKSWSSVYTKAVERIVRVLAQASGGSEPAAKDLDSVLHNWGAIIRAAAHASPHINQSEMFREMHLTLAMSARSEEAAPTWGRPGVAQRSCDIFIPRARTLPVSGRSRSRPL